MKKSSYEIFEFLAFSPTERVAFGTDDERVRRERGKVRVQLVDVLEVIDSESHGCRRAQRDRASKGRTNVVSQSQT
jgi:hypothetical protein